MNYTRDNCKLLSTQRPLKLHDIWWDILLFEKNMTVPTLPFMTDPLNSIINDLITWINLHKVMVLSISVVTCFKMHWNSFFMFGLGNLARLQQIVVLCSETLYIIIFSKLQGIMKRKNKLTNRYMHVFKSKI